MDATLVGGQDRIPGLPPGSARLAGWHSSPITPSFFLYPILYPSLYPFLFLDFSWLIEDNSAEGALSLIHFQVISGNSSSVIKSFVGRSDLIAAN